MQARPRRTRAGERTAPVASELAHRIARLALEKKAEAVTVLDLRELSSACDFFVLATGVAEPQVKAIADHIESTLADDRIRAWHVEGRQNRRWVLLDYVDVVVHVFHKETREYYRLESLWADAPREDLSGEEPGPLAAGKES
jgi:ribosome-associated protein